MPPSRHSHPSPCHSGFIEISSSSYFFFFSRCRRLFFHSVVDESSFLGCMTFFLPLNFCFSLVFSFIVLSFLCTLLLESKKEKVSTLLPCSPPRTCLISEKGSFAEPPLSSPSNPFLSFRVFGTTHPRVEYGRGVVHRTFSSPNLQSQIRDDRYFSFFLGFHLTLSWRLPCARLLALENRIVIIFFVDLVETCAGLFASFLHAETAFAYGLARPCFLEMPRSL